MKRTLAVSMVAVLLAGLAACSGNPFASGDFDSDGPSGGKSSTAGNSSVDPGEGGDPGAMGGQGGSASASGVGASATEGGAPLADGGAPFADGGAPVSDGAAGEGSEPTPPVFTMSKLIDDMEDGNGTLLESNGDWFVIKDDTGGTITPAKDEKFTMTALTPARGKSTKAATVTVSGFTDWGAAFGFDFAYLNGVRQAVDLKAALAVRFWVKASKATSLRLQLPNADTDMFGGKCSGTAENACNAHWTRGFKVGTEWQETTVLFSDLKQDLAGRRAPTFDKQHVYGAFFVIGPNQAVTVWLDDIALVH